jgi:hypothetical protein
MAWDPSGRRLAVLLRAPHPAAGLVAVYSTVLSPLLHAELIGFARPLAARPRGGGKGGGAAEDDAAGPHGGVGGGGAAAALAFAAAPAKGGAVLSVAGWVQGGRLEVANLALAL